MTPPTLPPFITRTPRRVYARTVQPTRPPHRTPQQKPSFLERHGDTITFIWTCILIAALIYTAFS